MNKYKIEIQIKNNLTFRKIRILNCGKIIKI